jgi:hypothetical protein
VTCDNDGNGNGNGKPLILLLSEGQVSDYHGAATVLQALPPSATTMIADRGFEARLVPSGSVRTRNGALLSKTIKPQDTNHLRHQNL